MEGTGTVKIEVKNVSFCYRRKQILSDISFQVKKGECLAIVGANGTGKSTLLSILAGIRKPKEGEVVCHGKTGYLPQGIALLEDMTVEDNLRFFAGLSKCGIPKELPFGLDQRRKERVGKLSGGQKRQVSIACALLGDPEILLLDEPAAALDIEYRDALLQLLQQLKKEGRTILYVGHDPMELADIYDNLLCLGSAVQYYSRESLSGENGDRTLFYRNYVDMIKQG